MPGFLSQSRSPTQPNLQACFSFPDRVVFSYRTEQQERCTIKGNQLRRIYHNLNCPHVKEKTAPKLSIQVETKTFITY